MRAALTLGQNSKIGGNFEEPRYARHSVNLAVNRGIKPCDNHVGCSVRSSIVRQTAIQSSF
jgi:hypothetical protein